MNSFKRFCLGFLSCALLLCSVKVIYAASSYSSTYQMTGEVFSQPEFSVTRYITTSITPSQGASGQSIWVYKAEKTVMGWAATNEIGSVSSVFGGSVTCNDAGTYKIYLRNCCGHVWLGNVSFTWE